MSSAEVGESVEVAQYARRRSLTSSLDDDEAVGEVVEIGNGDAAFGPGFEGGAEQRQGRLALP